MRPTSFDTALTFATAAPVAEARHVGIMVGFQRLSRRKQTNQPDGKVEAAQASTGRRPATRRPTFGVTGWL
jgi:hypothetical protein